jgi:ribonuclease HI
MLVGAPRTNDVCANRSHWRQNAHLRQSMTTLYIDGACKNNHLPAERRAAGAGVYVDFASDAAPAALDSLGGTADATAPAPRLPRFTWRPLRSASAASEPLTNNRAELLAAIVALELLLAHDQTRLARPIVVVNDSQLVHRSITEWLPGWRRRQYKKRDGAPVANLDLVRRLDALVQSAAPLRIEWRHMNSHCAEPADKSGAAWRAWHGNEVADRLANRACAQQIAARRHSMRHAAPVPRPRGKQ